MDRAKLRQELGRPEYAGLDAEQIRAAIYAVDRPTRQLVPLWRVKRALVEAQEWPMIVAGQTNPDVTVAGLCITIVSYVDDPRFEHLDMDLPSTRAMMAGAVSAGLTSKATVEAIDAMADGLISRAAELGIAEYHAGDIDDMIRSL